MRDGGQDAAGFQALQRRRAALNRSSQARPDHQRLAYPILPANGIAVRVFMMVQTQWRYAGEPPGRVGLDLGAVFPVMKALGVEDADQAETLSRLQVLEIAALKVFNQRRTAEMERIRRNQRTTRPTLPRGRR